MELFVRAEKRNSNSLIVTMLMEEVMQGLDDLFLKKVCILLQNTQMSFQTIECVCVREEGMLKIV